MLHGLAAEGRKLTVDETLHVKAIVEDHGGAALASRISPPPTTTHHTALSVSLQRFLSLPRSLAPSLSLSLSLSLLRAHTAPETALFALKVPHTLHAPTLRSCHTPCIEPARAKHERCLPSSGVLQRCAGTNSQVAARLAVFRSGQGGVPGLRGRFPRGHRAPRGLGGQVYS